MTEEKKQLARQEIRQRQEQASHEWIAEESQKILKNLMAHEAYCNAKVLFCYVNMQKEVQTIPLIVKALEAGKRVGVPLCLGPSVMEIREIRMLGDLEEGAYGILEPKPYTTVMNMEEVDYGIIPCVSCDWDGNRLGHGAGYYDRYLKDSDFTKAVLCFEEWMMDQIPVTELDVPVDVVVSQSRLLEIKKK